MATSSPTISRMQDAAPPPFDPYHKWLGIPPAEQPPTYYRLLGLSPLESDSDVIQNAADGRMAMLRSVQNGPHFKLSQELQGEVVTARNCLLNPEFKRRYDKMLGGHSDNTSPGRNQPGSATPPPHVTPAAHETPPYTLAPMTPTPLTPQFSVVRDPPARRQSMARPRFRTSTTRHRRPKNREYAAVQIVKIVGFGVVGLILGYLIVTQLLGIQL